MAYPRSLLCNCSKAKATRIGYPNTEKRVGLGRDGRGEWTCLSLERLLWPLRAEKMRESSNYDK